MNQAVDIRSESVSRWVTFPLDDESYGIDVMQIREMLCSVEISPIPALETPHGAK